MNIEIAKQRINQVIQADTNANSEADFLATHIPFEGIRIKAGGSSVDEFTQISEEQLFENYIKSPGDKHQLIVIYGSSGSGKSHLIRWFASKFAAINHENETVLYIRRNDNSLKGTIRQLLELDEIKDIPNKELYKKLAEAGQNIGVEELKNKIYYTFLSKIRSDEDTSVLSRPDKQKLLALMSNQDFQDRFFSSPDYNGPIDRIYRKIVPTEHTKGSNDVPARFSPSDFELDSDFILSMKDESDDRALRLAEKLNTNDYGSSEKTQQIAKYLNQFVDSVIQEIAGLQPGDFEEIFCVVREELYRKNKTLTLLIEDITAFTGVNAALLNVLADVHTGTALSNGHKMCRISSIIGTTTQYYNEFRENYIQRITNEIYIEDDLITKNHNSLVRFVARYLNAISLPAEELDQWLKAGADSSKLPIHEVSHGMNWDYVQISNGSRLPLYPFTQRAIINLFESLNEDKRTPRYVLSDIIRLALNNIINQPLQYPSFAINPTAIVGLSSSEQSYIMDQIDNPDDQKRLVRFICVWGDGTINDYTYDNHRYISGIRYEVFEEIGFSNIKGVSGEMPIPTNISKPAKEDTKATSIPAAPRDADKKYPQYDDASKMITRWALGEGHFEDSRNIFKKYLEEYIYNAIDWQSQGVSLDNAQKAKNYGLIEIEKSTRNTTGLYKIIANNENASIIDAFARWSFIGKESWDYDNSSQDLFVITKWLYRHQIEIVKLVKTYDGVSSVTYADYALSYYVYSLLFRGNELKTSEAGLLLESVIKTQPDAADSQGVHCEEWNDFRSSFATDKEAYDVVYSYFNLMLDDSSKKLFLCRSLADTHINKLLKNNFVVSGTEKDYISSRQFYIEKTRMFYPNIHKVVAAEEGFAVNTVAIILNELELEDISLLDESLLSDLKMSVMDYIESVKKADLQSCITCIDTDLIEDIYDHRDKMCSSAKLLNSAFLAKDDFKKLVRYAKNPLLYLSKLSMLLKQVRERIDTFKIELESSDTTSNVNEESIIVETKDEALKQIENTKKALKTILEDGSK